MLQERGWLRFGSFVLVLIAIGCGKTKGNSDEAAVVAAIQKLKGKVELEPEGPEQRVIKVYLHQTAVQNDDLAMLSKLPKLRNVFLGKTAISDAGLEHLGKLVELVTLSLNSTQVTDEGLKSLGKLTKLKTLNLQETKVTKQGIAALKKQFPTVMIAQ